MSVLDVAAAAVEGRDPDDPVLFVPGGVRTRGELGVSVRARAAQLRAGGVVRGRVLPLVLEPDEGGVLDLLAAWTVGAVPAPLNPRLTEPERDRARETLGAAPAGTQAVLWTSGTQGRPRGVALGSAGLEAHVRAVSERLGLDGSEVWLASLSPAHIGGLALVARALLTGAALVLAGPTDTDTLVRLLGGDPAAPPPAPVTHLSLVPTQLDRVLEAWGSLPPPPTLRCVLIGGAHAPDDLVRRAIERGWPLALTYGMTEMWSQVATATPEVTRARPGVVGRPLSGVELRIGPGGEILVRGPTRALGYVGADGAGEEITDGEGWYHTGDLGQWESDGALRITGRRSDRIVTGGVNVDPAEVEDVLRTHPGVSDAAVVGLPSRTWGETVGALVVPTAGRIDLADLEAFARTRLSGPKRPRVWKTSSELPRNANGKVDRAAVRASLAED